MQVKTYKAFSQALFVAGTLSIAGSLVTWFSGRITGDVKKQNDGLFIGLWVPSLWALSDRLAIAALDKEEQDAYMYEDEEERIQSPSPLSHVKR